MITPLKILFCTSLSYSANTPPHVVPSETNRTHACAEPPHSHLLPRRDPRTCHLPRRPHPAFFLAGAHAPPLSFPPPPHHNPPSFLAGLPAPQTSSPPGSCTPTRRPSWPPDPSPAVQERCAASRPCLSQREISPFPIPLPPARPAASRLLPRTASTAGSGRREAPAPHSPEKREISPFPIPLPPARPAPSRPLPRTASTDRSGRREAPAPHSPENLLPSTHQVPSPPPPPPPPPLRSGTSAKHKAGSTSTTRLPRPDRAGLPHASLILGFPSPEILRPPLRAPTRRHAMSEHLCLRSGGGMCLQ
ncbi:hypothetical protein VPH35_072565 [Triticum aestivum]